jgi:hypothetical protein
MELVKKDLEYTNLKGEKVREVVYFRELSAGDTLKIVEGQRYKGNPKRGDLELDIAGNQEMSMKLVQLSLTNEDGRRIFTDMAEAKKCNGRRMAALMKLANLVHKEGTDADKSDEEESLETPTPGESAARKD